MHGQVNTSPLFKEMTLRQRGGERIFPRLQREQSKIRTQEAEIQETCSQACLLWKTQGADRPFPSEKSDLPAFKKKSVPYDGNHVLNLSLKDFLGF